jgi:hypothetical protein
VDFIKRDQRIFGQYLLQHIFIGKTEIPSFTSYDDVIKNRDSKQPIREAYPIVKTKKSEN